MLFTSLGRSVSGKTVPSRPRAQFSLIQISQLTNKLYIFSTGRSRNSNFFRGVKRKKIRMRTTPSSPGLQPRLLNKMILEKDHRFLAAVYHRWIQIMLLRGNLRRLTLVGSYLPQQRSNVCVKSLKCIKITSNAQAHYFNLLLPWDSCCGALLCYQAKKKKLEVDLTHLNKLKRLH